MGAIGTGATLTSSSASWAAQITNISHGGMDREAVDVSHLTSTEYREFLIGKLTDPGELSVDFIMDVAQKPPLLGTKELWTVVLPIMASSATTVLTGAKVSGNGALTSFNYDVPLEDKITGSCSIKFLGALSFATQTT